MTETELRTRENLPTQDDQDENRLVRGCLVRKMVGRWGPYLYSVTKRHGKQTWKYLGRADGLVRGRPAFAGDSEPVQLEVRE
jgi:hypothetical protein